MFNKQSLEARLHRKFETLVSWEEKSTYNKFTEGYKCSSNLWNYKINLDKNKNVQPFKNFKELGIFRQEILRYSYQTHWKPG